MQSRGLLADRHWTPFGQRVSGNAESGQHALVHSLLSSRDWSNKERWVPANN